MDAIEQRQAALTQLATLAPSPLTAPEVAIDDDDDFGPLPLMVDEDGSGMAGDDDDFDDHLKRSGQYVDWEPVARNIAASVEDGPVIFSRQRATHTFPLISALDALPPGLKAYLLILSSRIETLEKQVERYEQQTVREMTALEGRLAAVELAQEREGYAAKMGGE